MLDDVQGAPIDKLPWTRGGSPSRRRVGDVRARIVRPAGAVGTLPVILYTHGGGWVLGNVATHERSCAN